LHNGIFAFNIDAYFVLGIVLCNQSMATLARFNLPI